MRGGKKEERGEEERKEKRKDESAILLLRGYTQLRAREREREESSRPGTRGSSQIVDGVGSMLVTGPPDPGVALTHLFADLWLGVVSPADFYHGQKLS